MQLDELVQDIFRKIGRNVVLFQQIEQALKHIASNTFSSYGSELDKKLENHRKCIQKKTLGQLVGNYPLKVEGEEEPETYVDEDRMEPYASFSFSIVGNETFVLNRKQALANLVEDRNNLVHHLLNNYDLNSIESCHNLSEFLDQQAEKLRLEIKQFNVSIDFLTQMKSKFLNSNELARLLVEATSYQTYLKIILSEIAVDLARPDGWTCMSHAANILKTQASEELQELRKSLEHKTLKSFMMASDLFEFKMEVTPKGGERMLYRLKNDGTPNN